MTIEWGNLLHHRPREIPPNDLKLRGGPAGYLLLFHGLTGSPVELAYVAHHLHHRNRYTVWCPRLLNHGQPLGVLARTDAREFLEFAETCFQIARAEARSANLPLFVGGLSLGAVLSLLLAADHPLDMSGTICLAPTLFYDGWNVPWTHRLIPIVSYTPLKYFAYFREDAPYGIRDESLRARIALQYRQVSLDEMGDISTAGYAHFPVRLFCEIRHIMSRCLRRLDRVSCPVLLVQAVNDDITGPENSEVIYRGIRSSRKEIVLLHDSYHVVTADLEREKVAREVARFCDSCKATEIVPAIAPGTP